MARGAHLFVVFAVAAVGCGAPDRNPPEPLGRIPHVVTTAEPEWIPFVIRVGRPVEADPREKHLADLRQLTYAQGENAEEVLVARRAQAHLPVDPRRLRVRPGVRDGPRERRDQADLRRHRADDVRLLLLPEGRPRPLFADERRELPAEGRSLPGLRVAARRVRHLHGQTRRLGQEALDRRAGLRRRDDGELRRHAPRLHQHARRRHRSLHVEAGRHRHPADHQHGRLRRRRHLLAGLVEARLAGEPADGTGARRVQAASRQRRRQADGARHLRRGRRGSEPAPRHQQRQGELRALVPARLAARHLRLERRRVAAPGAGAEFRPLRRGPGRASDERRRAAARARHLL